MKFFFIIMLLLISCSASVSGTKIFSAYIQTSKTDERDRPKEIYILVDDQEYKIVNNEQGKLLLDYVDKKMAIKGEVSGSVDGEKFIEVKKFQLDE